MTKPSAENMNNWKSQIYFAGSIRGGRQYVERYKYIVDNLFKYGKVLTEHVGLLELEKAEKHKIDTEIFNEDMNWLNTADVVVADISIHSMGVGFELGFAWSKNIPVLCLCNETDKEAVSAMITGNPDFDIKYYKSNFDLGEILLEYFSKHN